MKFNFNVKDITVNNINIGSIEIGTELSITEVRALNTMTEEFLDKLPTYLEKLEIAQNKFEEIETRISTKQEMMRKVKNIILKEEYSCLK